MPDDSVRVEGDSHPPGVPWAVVQDIARRLREFGYATTTAKDVETELQLPDDRRSVIGGMAVNMLEDYP